MNNAITYLRVSTKEQAEGYSIAAQEAACRRYIDEKGWTLASVFSDRGESARTADRPQFQMLLRLLEEDRSIRYLVVHKLDRLARNIKDYANIRELLDRIGVQLVSVTEGLEATASGKMVEGMLAVVAEWYSNNLSTEVKKGQMQKILQGDWPTIAPIGYRNVRLEPDNGQRRGKATIVPDSQSNLVRQAFELYATGRWPLTSLTEELHKRGLRNRRGGHLTRAGLWVVLTNPAYIGKIPWTGALYDGSHEPIVPQNLFNRVQQVLASHGRSKERQRKHTHFLKGMLTCDLCGKRLLFNVVKNRKKQDFAYFACASHFKPGSKCEEPYLPAREIERQVEQLYRKVDIPPELKRRIETMLEEEVAQLERNRADTTHFAARRLQRLAKEKERLLDLYLQEGIDRSTFIERKSRIEAEIFDLETKMGDQTETIQQARELISAAVKLARNCYAAYRKASPETKKIWNQALFAEIVTKDKKILKVTYQEPFRTLLSLGACRENLRPRNLAPFGPTPSRVATSPHTTPSRSGGSHSPPRVRWSTLFDRLLGGSNKTLLVGATGFEPVTPAL